VTFNSGNIVLDCNMNWEVAYVLELQCKIIKTYRGELCCDIQQWQYILGLPHELGGGLRFGFAMQECALDSGAEALPGFSARRKKGEWNDCKYKYGIKSRML
jgi:hypothetical protein